MNVLMSRIVAATMVYLGFSLLVVVNLLWDAIGAVHSHDKCTRQPSCRKDRDQHVGDRLVQHPHLGAVDLEAAPGQALTPC